jgi:hypothetical protein
VILQHHAGGHLQLSGVAALLGTRWRWRQQNQHRQTRETKQPNHVSPKNPQRRQAQSAISYRGEWHENLARMAANHVRITRLAGQKWGLPFAIVRPVTAMFMACR